MPPNHPRETGLAKITIDILTAKIRGNFSSLFYLTFHSHLTLLSVHALFLEILSPGESLLSHNINTLLVSLSLWPLLILLQAPLSLLLQQCLRQIVFE